MCDKIAVSLEEELSPESFYSTKMIANTFNCTGLVESCNKYALENFQAIAAEDYSKHLDKDYVSALVGSKEVNPLVFDSARCLKALLKIFTGESHVVAEDIDIKDVKRTTAIQAFNPKIKTWTKLQGISDKFVDKHFTAIVLGNIIYVIVFDGTNYQLNYTDNNATWVRLTDRGTAKNRVDAVVFEGSIYAFDDSGKTSKTVEKFDPSDGTWSQVTCKHVEGYCTSIVDAGGFIYCIGGYNGEHMSNAIKFNPSDSTWTTLTSMPTARNGAAAVELYGKIYVMGGYNNGWLNVVECFDTVAEIWTTVARLSNSRYSFKACVVGGNIFTLGGCRNNSKNTIEEYDPAVDSWKVVETMDGKDIQTRASIALNVPSD
uniref:kelch-like protein 12 n=1 Tax=Styela clava TaxID=7725 RepID=UPI00193ABF50|nr:kelch-like protein 12 [Styela clava]